LEIDWKYIPSDEDEAGHENAKGLLVVKVQSNWIKVAAIYHYNLPSEMME
jgi:hypothetical protein